MGRRRPDSDDEDEYFTSVVDTSHNKTLGVQSRSSSTGSANKQSPANQGWSLRTKILIGLLIVVGVSGAAIVAFLVVENPPSDKPKPPQKEPSLVIEEPLDPGECNLAEGSPLPTFDPPQNDLVLWLRSDEGLVHNKASGGEVEEWQDRSGKDHHFRTNAFRDYLKPREPDKAPIAVPRALGCFPSVRFSGAQALQRSDTLGMTPEGGKTYIVVMRLAEKAIRTQSFGQSLPLDLQHHICLETNTWKTRGNRFGAYVMGASFDSYAPTHRDLAVHALTIENLSQGSPLVATDGQPSVLNYRINSVPITLLQTAGPSQVQLSPAKLTYTAIGRCVGPARSYLHGDVFEILVYDVALSGEQLKEVEGGLLSKYGLR